LNRSLLQLCLSIGSLLIVFLSIGNLLQLCLSNLKPLASCSSEQLSSDITFLVNSVTAQFSLDLILIVFMCVWLCSYVINYMVCILMGFRVRRVFWSFASKVKLVISWWELFLVLQVKTIFFTKLLFGGDN